MSIPVSILICTRNRAASLQQTLASVAQLDVPAGFDPELVVVDNGSTDGTPGLVRALELESMPVRLVSEPTPGVATARNAALRAAEGDVLLVTDDDTRLPRNWIAAMCRPILSGKAEAVAGEVVLAPHLQRPWMEPFHRAILSATECMDREDPQDMFGASMAFSRLVLARVPGFDPELGPGTAIGALEDTLFAWQLRRAGYRVAFASEAPVEHHFDERRLTRASLAAAAARHGRARAYMAYHWQHTPYAVSRRARSPELNLAVRLGLLAAWRARHPGAWRAPEGIARQEFALIRQISAIRQYFRERERPPNYEPKGLVKRRGPRPQGAAHGVHEHA